eukprot:6813387-Prymnesium_polylepis.1
MDMLCVCASVCGAGHAHLRGWEHGTDPHPRMRSPGASCTACSAAAETSPASSCPCPAISTATPLHTSVP